MINIDVVVFGVYLVAVALVGYFASRKEKGVGRLFPGRILLSPR